MVEEEAHEITASDIELKVEDIPVDFFLDVTKNAVFKGSKPIGDGALLALKLALQATENCVLVISSGSMSKVVSNRATIYAGHNAAAVAAGVSRAIKDVPIICFAGDRSTQMHFSSIMGAAENNERFVYICYNNFGGSETKYFRNNTGSFVRNLRGAYAATASIAYPEDYLQKIKKIIQSGDFGFIDVLAPSPKMWGFETSNTVQIARLGVDTKIWPLYEVTKNDRVSITKRPKAFEPVERFFDSSDLFRKTQQEEREKLQKQVDYNWKLLEDRKMI